MSACDCGIPGDARRAPRRGGLARNVEQREVKRREQEATRQEVESYYSQQKHFEVTTGNPLRDDIKRKGKEARERSAEADLAESLYQSERANELALIRAEEEDRLAAALARRMHEQERHEKEVQHLREQSAELRELAVKINAARVNKERTLQLAEKADLRQQQAEYDAAIHLSVEQNALAGAAREAEALARRREQALKAREVQVEQIQERQDMLREAEAQAARERAMVDEIVRRIQDEDRAHESLRRQKQDETKAYIARYLAESEVTKQQKREAEAAEDRKVAEYWQAVREREAENAAKAAARQEVADRMYEKVKREMEEAQRAKDEEDRLIDLLRQEELEEKHLQEEADKKRRAEEMKQEMMRANEHQMRLRIEREREMKAEEEAFRARMMAKFAEDDRLEQLNAQKRRMKQQEHTRAVQAMVDERRQMYEAQKAREEAELAAQAAEEARRRGIIEEERRRMLREAADLKEYLPRGVLRDQSDLALINNQLANASLQPQPRPQRR
ncbi:flagellar associated protein [Haematococcus lacustris]